MSNDINKAIISATLGADPELRFTQGGTAILSLRICSTTTYLDRNKERKERQAWLNAKVIGARAEPLSKILAKGQRVMIEGSIETGSYEDREGRKRQTFEIVCQEIVLAGGGKRGQSTDAEPTGHGTPGERQRQDAAPAQEPPPDYNDGGGFGSDDDIPF